MNLPRWWWGLLLVAVALGVMVGMRAPQNLPLLGYKLLLLSVAALTSTVFDRLFFKPERKVLPFANIARALVFGAIVLGLTLGV